ncbi:MAG: OmpA family protein [Elusimicrobiota bacterium]|jgi:outer membrane protein OmpA-like peptidoglycan-associated protein|nr:OmpA family protein [Elusimicrobiota bacterium]
MRFFLMFSFIFTLLLSGCSSANKQQNADQAKSERFTKSAVCPMRDNEDKWRKQSVSKMRETRKIPSVDFEFDSIILDPSAYLVLDKIAEIMTTNRTYKLIVEGNTDQVGSDEYNDNLSKQRANAIKSYLVSRGVYGDSITTYGHGKRRPLVYDDSPEGRACNRRVEFTLTTRHWATVY